MSRMVQFAWAALRPSRPEPGLAILDPVVSRMRVLPQDLDFMMVVNNGTYLQLMGVTGYRHMGKNGALRLAAKRSWIGFVAASTMRFVHRRSRERIDPRDIVPLLAEQQGYADAVPDSPELPADVVAWARSWQNLAATNAPRAAAGAGTEGNR